jgi:hypothetical protein
LPACDDAFEVSNAGYRYLLIEQGSYRLLLAALKAMSLTFCKLIMRLKQKLGDPFVKQKNEHQSSKQKATARDSRVCVLKQALWASAVSGGLPPC